MSYMTRALKAKDRRYAAVLAKLGYGNPPPVEPAPEGVPVPATEPVEDLAELRAEYERAVGRRPFMGWDAATIRERMNEYLQD